MLDDVTKAAQALASGAEFPYEEPEDTPVSAAVDWAHAAARGVLDDLCGRKSIEDVLENIDYDIRIEIVTSLAAIIRQAHFVFEQS